MRTSELVRHTAVITLTVLAMVGLVFLLVKIRSILLWVLVGVILAIALEPAVAWLERHGFGRIVAALLVSLATIAGLVAAIVAIALPVVLQSNTFIRALPRLVNSVFRTGGSLHFLETRFHVIERLSAVTPAQVFHVLAGNQATIVSAVTKAASIVAATVTILVIMVMLLIEGPRAWNSVLGVLKGEERRWTERIGQNFLRATGGYVRGNLAISVVAGLASYVMLKIVGTPYAETLAVLVAILDIIPLVGATIGAVIVSVVAFATGGGTDGVVVIIFFIVYQQFENNVLQNIVYAKTLTLSPLVVFIAALIGASLAGIVGVLLAIPLCSAGWTLARDLLALRRSQAVPTGEGAAASSAAAQPPPHPPPKSPPPAPPQAPDGP